MPRSIPLKIEGILEPHFETGTEGIVWSVYADRRPEAAHEQWSYNKLHTLRDGDRLVIYAPDNKTVVFEEVICLDWETSIEMDPGPGGQVALGLWVNGIQKGYDADEWAMFFFPHHWMGNPEEGYRPLWATLYKAPKVSLKPPSWYTKAKSEPARRSRRSP